MTEQYTPLDKMETVWKLRRQTYEEVSQETGVPIEIIEDWQKNYEDIHAEFHRYLDDEAIHTLMLAQKDIADKISELVSAMTADKIASAPLNQLSSALGVLVDRFLRIQDAKDIEKDTDNTFRVEYYDASTGEISDTPPWTDDDSEDGAPLYNSFMWETLRENRTRQAGNNRDGSERYADMVARTHVSDGRSSVARFEENDDERDWYRD